MMRALVLGGGFAGTTIANLLTAEGWAVDLIEKERQLGGGCRTFFYGGHPFTYGPRVYYGYSEAVYSYLDSVVPLRRFPFELQTYVEDEGRFFSYPIHEDDIPKMSRAEKIREELKLADNTVEPNDFEEYWINRVGETLYNMFVNQYSKKMWMIDSNKIFDIFKWSAKDKPIETGAKTAYKGSYIGYPVPFDGYNSYFDEMVQDVNVHLSAEIASIDVENSALTLSDGKKMSADLIVSTIPIDELLSYKYGELPYAGRDFEVFILPVKQAFPGDVRFCHYAGSERHTRITEFKKITYYDSEDSLFVLEKPSKNNKLYPYLTKKNMQLVEQYMADLPEKVLSIGRLGTYKYSTIEQTIVQAHVAFTEITGKVRNGIGEAEFFGIGDTSLMKDRKESAGVKK